MGRSTDGGHNSTSVIQNLNYFDGINAVRDEQNSFYMQQVLQKQKQQSLMEQVIKMTRKNLAAGIQEKHYSNYGCGNNLSSTKRKRSTNRIKMASLKSRQHDEYARLNYYH